MSLFTDLKEVFTAYASRIKGLDDQVSEVQAGLDNKVNIRQGVPYAGKALIVGDDGNVIPSDAESCFNADFIHAFINILKDVPYISGNAEQYIDDITNAMIGGDKRLVSITATYDPGQNEIHQYDNVESIRNYTTVTARFDDGTTRNVTDFSMTGNFAEAQSVITIDYFGKTTQIIVNVTIDSHLMYYLTKGTELNGIHGIDTGIKLSDVDKNLTILADITDTSILQSLRSNQLLCDRNSSSGAASYQIYMPALEKSAGVYKKRYYAYGNAGPQVGGGEFSNDVHRLKVGIRHYKDSGVCMIYLKVDNTVLNNMTNVNSTFRANDQTAFIGERPDGGYQWKGRVNLFNIYDYGLTMDQMKALLGEA